MQNMETLMEKHNCYKNTNPSTLLSVNKSSQTISKPIPKIRIIHIFAPQIIKTDAANFRELVQRLTGKTPHAEINCTKKKMPKISKPINLVSSSNKKMEMALRGGFGFGEMIKGEEEIWTSANSGGGFLGGFGDQFEYGFMQEINDHEFPFLEGATQMDAYEETVQLVN